MRYELDSKKGDFLMLLCLYLYFEETFVKLMIKIPSLYPWLVDGNHRCCGRYRHSESSDVGKRAISGVRLEIRIT